MTTSTIEQLDQSRYNNIKWFAIIWAVWFGTFILKDVITNKIIVLVIITIGLVAWVFWMINFYRLFKLGKIVNANEKLKNALNDELMQYNRDKAFVYGYWLTLIAICILMALSIYTDISALLFCQMAMFVSVLSGLIVSLILNKG